MRHQNQNKLTGILEDPVPIGWRTSKEMLRGRKERLRVGEGDTN